MGTAFYVFETEEEYDKMYKERVKEKIHHSPVTAMYLSLDKVKENHLWVCHESSKEKERPRMERSIVHFRNGEHNMLQYKNGEEIQVQKKNIKFDKGKMKIKIMPKTLRKSLLEFRVDRYYGHDINPKAKAESQTYYYDTVMDRINIILKPKVIKINLKPSHSRFPTKSQIFTVGHMNPTGTKSSSSY
jgi:hypothetical protein